MERLTKARMPFRGQFTKKVKRILTYLEGEEVDTVKLDGLIRELEDIHNNLTKLDSQLLEELLDNNCSEEDYFAEHESIQNYSSEWHHICAKVDKVLKSKRQSPTNSESSFVTGNDDIRSSKKKSFKLPKIELKQFGGDLKEWLGFWAQFSKIHEDEDLHTADKFHYLLQALVPGTEARELIESFPPSAENYPKAVEVLKNRFGKEELLVQVYVRELLKLAFNNVIDKEKMPLSKMYIKLKAHLRSLESLNLATADPSTWLFPLVESSLPGELLRTWQRSPLSKKNGKAENNPKTNLDYLMEFLESEVEGEQKVELAEHGFQTVSIQEKNNKPHESKAGKERNVKRESIHTAAGLHVGKSNSTCLFCDKSHPSQECFKAVDMALVEKSKIITEKKACFKCLRVGHNAKSCRSFVKCSGCSKPHYHIMCPESSKNKPNSVQQEKGKVATTTVSANQVGGVVLLQTLLVNIKGSVTRMLIDNGSQKSYIRNALFGGVLSEVEKRTVYQVPVSQVNQKETMRKLRLSDKPKIADHIPQVPKGPWLKELKAKRIWISDVEKSGVKAQGIDILIGADLLPDLLTGKTEKLKCGLYAVETIFGWTLMGQLPGRRDREDTTNALMSTSLLLTDASITQLWELEAIGIRDPADQKTTQEKNAEVHKNFEKTLSRKEEGRYCVSLPWVSEVPNIPHNYAVAKRRLEGATQKLKKDGKYEIYDQVFTQWEAEGLIEKVELDFENCHYIPHRPVYKPDSKTTPVRPVFDASCKVGRSPSLNDCLETGPNLIELIPSIMLRFREENIGVISDVRKAFQMVEVCPRDQKFLRFLWWEDNTCKKLIVLQHKRVVFGVNCSPFILGAVINYHLDHCKEGDREVAIKLKNSLYVDNCVTSVRNNEEYLHFKENAIRIMKDAAMELREWERGAEETPGIGQLTSSGCGLGVVSDLNEASSVLGMKWDKVNDTLTCVAVPEIPVLLTKRSLLSTVHKIFDPMGFLSPAMVYPKIMLQETWGLKLGWDEELPQETKTKFEDWVKELKSLEQVHIPRKMKGNNCLNNENSLQFHGFCDASGKAYAAAVFLRALQEDGSVSVQLLQAKTRIAPLKKSTIPRLELLSALILSRLVLSIKDALKYEIPTFLWSDSTTALSWIKRNDDWGTFVGNRVKEIAQNTNPLDWRHVPGNKNPADFPSRGCTPKNLLGSQWWEGPCWLRDPENQWPGEEFKVNEDLVNEEKKKSVQITNTSKNVTIITEEPWYASKRFSSYKSSIRVIAWMLRFINNAGHNQNKSGPLLIQEIGKAEIIMFKLIQEEVFKSKDDYIAGIQVQRNDGLICVKTKIVNRQDLSSFRSPILLPNSHPIVERMIRDTHLQYGHGGAQFLIAKLREKVWIVQTRKAVRKVIKSCVVCKRFREKPASAPVAPLPENRVKSAKAFEITGVDLAGPLYLKNRTKTWIVIFTCAVVRAVHLELVNSLDTSTFILALSRFVSRRGRPSIIYSDNGTNFRGAENSFRALDWDRIRKATEVQRIQWIFNPPSASWWGGFWERLVQTVKDLLRKMLGHSKLSYVQLETMLAHVESVVNGRPLTYVSEDPDDLIPLTPAVFLQDVIETRLPELEVLNGDSLRQKYRDLVQMKDEFQKRFRSEYLGQLVQRVKSKPRRQLTVGEIVLVASDNMKRLEWPMAKILELIPGSSKIIPDAWNY